MVDILGNKFKLINNIFLNSNNKLNLAWVEKIGGRLKTFILKFLCKCQDLVSICATCVNILRFSMSCSRSAKFVGTNNQSTRFRAIRTQRWNCFWTKLQEISQRLGRYQNLKLFRRDWLLSVHLVYGLTNLTFS